MSDWRTPLFAGAFTMTGALITGIAQWWTHRRPRKMVEAAETEAEAAWQSAMNDGFAKLAKQYEERNKELVDEVGELRGEIRGLAAHVEGLETILRANGLPIPRRPVPVNLDGLTTIVGGKKL